MTTEQIHLEKAAAAERAAQESFDHCDTDGFLSQWAHGMTAELERAKARIAADGGTSVFEGLYEGQRRVKARVIVSKFGPSWMLDEAEDDLIARRGKRYLPYGENSRILRDLGLAHKEEIDDAYADIQGSGTGLAGCASCRVVVRRCDPWGKNPQRVEG